MRCDLHVHSSRSGPVDLPGLGRFAHESYSHPVAVYEAARRKGMDLVTLTDHDTISGALDIAHLPGTFVSEEVSCVLPTGRLLHLGVYDLTERQHVQIARLRQDAEGLFAYLAEQRVPACLNHPFSALTGRRQVSDLRHALSELPLIETRNGMMSAAVNSYAAAAGRDARLGMIGGSDAHTLATVAGAFTMVPSARTREEFLAGLRRGMTLPAGRSGTYARLARAVGRIMAAAYCDRARRSHATFRDLGLFAFMLSALPAALACFPFATAAIYAHEQLFARRLHRRYRESVWTVHGRPAAPGPLGPSAATSPAS